MGIVNYNGTCKIYDTDYYTVQTCKIKEGAKCYVCGGIISKGSYCLGRGYFKFCLSCSDKFFKNLREELKRFLKTIKNTEKELKDNADTYKTNNLACNI